MTKITSEPFGVTKQGEPVRRFTMENESGMRVRVLSYGCTVQSIEVPGPGGTTVDVALGYDDLAGYEAGSCFFGAFVGRYANRIKGARFELNGTTYQLERNDGNNHLHGSYCHRVFQGRAVDGELVFDFVSPDGEEGYPGTLTVQVRYSLTGDNTLTMAYSAATDQDTVLNLTNHTYFNLNGQDGSDVLDHELRLNAEAFTEGDRETLPTGKILPVEGTPMDFREGKAIGAELLCGDPQLVMCRGYDHNFILNRESDGLGWFASASSARTGIRMDCYTTQPAVQLYTGNYVDDDAAPCGKGGIRYPRYGGFCLETQHYPCSPNFPDFPSTVLRPGETYHHVTGYRFSI